jgi:hypothetical protein
MPGHCIDAAIHIAAGARQLLAATRPFKGCATGMGWLVLLVSSRDITLLLC